MGVYLCSYLIVYNSDSLIVLTSIYNYISTVFYNNTHFVITRLQMFM